MQDTYGIFTTDGEIVSGSLTDEYAVNLAEMLDESTASLYISTRNGALLMGTAVNVQKKGRRPDTVIYLEKSGYDAYLSHIDLSYVQDFYARVRRTLEQNDYEVRNLASDDNFFDERNMRLTSKMSDIGTADYAIGRLLLGKNVLAVSDNLSKSVDYAVLVAGKLKTYLSAGFTIVVAKRTFRDADLMIVDKVSGGYQINLATETVTGGFISDIYRHIGVFAQKPDVMQGFSGREPLNRIAERVVTEFERTQNISPAGRKQYADFIVSERIREFYSAPAPRAFSSESYSESRRQDTKFDKTGYNSKWVVTDSDRDKVMREYEEHMEKKHKTRLTVIGVIIVALLVCGAVGFVVIDPLGLGLLKKGDPNSGEPDVHQINPSENIPNTNMFDVFPSDVEVRNIPGGFKAFGSQYNVTLVESPQLVALPLNTNPYALDSHAELIVMKLDTATGYWSQTGTVDKIRSDEVWATLPDSGIYHLFYRITPEMTVTGGTPFSEPPANPTASPQSPPDMPNGNVNNGNNGI